MDDGREGQEHLKDPRSGASENIYKQSHIRSSNVICGDDWCGKDIIE